ncbi:MFS transporter [Streptomyces sp. I05A-00742]|uniref:MDR family MFS transporter n=1 Tax=Streptomyces sp. I05A-00742 TaxID=2732853 RepID=UPI0014891021|nr:MFS transporter [Streptomyces sp. I05A-00742]
MGRAARESVAGLPRAFWWLWVATLVNRLGGFVATFLALYLTMERGYSASYAGLVAALHGLGGVVASLGAGVMTDRLGRRPTLMIAQVSTAASVALLGFVHDPVPIAGAAFLVGLTSNASRPAVTAMMADIIRPEDRLRAYSINYWAINMGFAVSSTAAGFVAEYSYLAGFLGEAAITLACAVLCYFTLPESRPEPVAPSGPGEAAPAVGLGSVLRDGRFMGVTGLAFLVAVIFHQSSVALPVAMGREGLSTQDYGMVMAVNGIMIVVLQIPVTRVIERHDPRRLLVFSALLAGYGFGLTAFAGSVGVFALTIVVWTLAEIINSPTQSGMVVRFSPLHARGRYQGVFSLSWTLAALVAPLTGGVIIEEFGAGVLWAGCAVVGTIAGAGYWLLTRDLPEEGAAETPVAQGKTPATGQPEAEAMPA